MSLQAARQTRGAAHAASVAQVDDRRGLAAVLEPGVPAAIAAAPADEPRRDALSARVAAGAFRIARSVLPAATRDDVERWLARLPDGDDAVMLAALRNDVLSLVEQQGELDGRIAVPREDIHRHAVASFAASTSTPSPRARPRLACCGSTGAAGRTTSSRRT